jgi:short-subunit dehydrogenase
MLRFKGKQVLVIGASGGLGAAYAQAFVAEGALVSLTARDPAALDTLKRKINAIGTFALDLENVESIQTMRSDVEHDLPELSIVVNATGVDVRKPFEVHTLAEIDRTLNLNLRGSILITQALLPLLRRNQGMIVHMGGFADGRLAFPFYAADAASRAGLRTFAESINREVAGSGTIVSYFSPSPADTEAERPFHPVWRQMGLKIATVDEVAKALLDAVAHRKRVAIMGGRLTVAFARLNAAFPGLADRIMMNRYSRQMRAYIVQGDQIVIKPRSNVLQLLGVLLIIASFLLYGIGLLVIPFLTLDAAVKALLIGGTLAFGELTFWVGAALAGSAVVSRYRNCFNPRNWFKSRSGL